MLRGLDPVFDALAETGWRLAIALIAHPYAVAFAVAATLLFVSRHCSPTAAIGLVALAAASWGQACILSDEIMFGGCLYAVAFSAAVVAGTRVDIDQQRASQPRLSSGADLSAVLVLVFVSVLLRLYSIEAIPWFVDVEPASAYLESLTPYGMARYVTHNRVLDDGYVHMLGRWASVQMLGPSIVSLRLVSVAFGVLSVLLCYAVARQFVGPSWAFAAGVLLATDSAHLFWSRIEASQIIAATAGTFLSALLALWLSRSWSLSAAIGVMFWMPLTRYFYAAALGMVSVPVLVCVAGLARRSWRKACLRVLPFVLAGCALWFHSSALLQFAATGHWQKVSTLNVYGRTMIEPHDPRNELSGSSLGGLVEFQASRLVSNGKRLSDHLVRHRETFSNWLMMAQPDIRHRRSANAAIVALLVPAVGFLVGACGDPRMMALLLWLCALIVPGMWSEDPEPRRVVGLMAALPLVAVVFLARGIGSGLGRPWSQICFGGLALAIGACVVMTNLASHLLTGRQNTEVARYIEFVAPVFAEADVVYHNIEDEALAGTLVFGNADVFLRRRPCFSAMADWRAEWAAITTGNTRCSPDDPIYQHLDWSGEADTVKQTRTTMRNVAYLIEIDSPVAIDLYERLRKHLPQASMLRQKFAVPPNGPRDVVLLQANIAL